MVQCTNICYIVLKFNPLYETAQTHLFIDLVFAEHPGQVVHDFLRIKPLCINAVVSVAKFYRLQDQRNPT